jgi:hypothetical protein
MRRYATDGAGNHCDQEYCSRNRHGDRFRPSLSASSHIDFRFRLRVPVTNVSGYRGFFGKRDESKKYLGAATCYLRLVISDLIREYFYSFKNGYLHELIA